MQDSERYEAQAQAVLRMAARAGNSTEKEVYLSIADGWRRLAAEAARNEHRVEPEERTFSNKDKDGSRRCD
jgi:uracil-DNA glycosylase